MIKNGINDRSESITNAITTSIIDKDQSYYGISSVVQSVLGFKVRKFNYCPRN